VYINKNEYSTALVYPKKDGFTHINVSPFGKTTFNDTIGPTARYNYTINNTTGDTLERLIYFSSRIDCGVKILTGGKLHKLELAYLSKLRVPSTINTSATIAILIGERILADATLQSILANNPLPFACYTPYTSKDVTIAMELKSYIPYVKILSDYSDMLRSNKFTKGTKFSIADVKVVTMQYTNNIEVSNDAVFKTLINV